MICKSLRIRVLSIFLLTVFLVACSEEEAPPPPDPATVLQAIPQADPAKYQHIRDMKNWRNPYLIVHSDGVVLFDAADSAEIVLKTDELLPALAKLPSSNWPYGRVVAVAEDTSKGSQQDGVALRRTRGIVGGILEGTHIAIEWVPSPSHAAHS